MNKFFCIFYILLFISKTENVFSTSLIYDVNNVEVKGKINNNLTNKQLIELGFEKAFNIFIDKTLLIEDAISLNKTKLDTIKDLVLTYQIVKSERNNTNETLITLNIKFDSKKINNFLSKRKISYADISNISLTILPIFISNKKILLYDDNIFYKNWNKTTETTALKENRLINYNLALENIEDL